MVKGLEERYRFWEVPRKLVEFDSTRGMHFQHGSFKEITIDKLTLYENGAACESSDGDTSQLEDFIDDALTWAGKTFKVDTARFKKGPRMFLSNVIVQADVGLGEKFQALAGIGAKVAQAMRSYGLQAPDYQVSSITLNGDYTGIGGLRPGVFSFERRVGEPYSSGLYFSSAPLRTPDHMRLLDEIEAVLA